MGIRTILIARKSMIILWPPASVLLAVLISHREGGEKKQLRYVSKIVFVKYSQSDQLCYLLIFQLCVSTRKSLMTNASTSLMSVARKIHVGIHSLYSM